MRHWLENLLKLLVCSVKWVKKAVMLSCRDWILLLVLHHHQKKCTSEGSIYTGVLHKA